MADEHYQVLARKWRPQSFEDVVGQAHITQTLQNAIRAGRIGHAFLFIGSRGIGKTTTARILAKALNCTATDGPTPTPCGACDNCRSIAAGNNIDVMEIDGASNNSVEDVRQIREYVRLVPSASRYKIYVIDEVHQLSMSAFNALLKTLEEPPQHAVFILATTDAHKIPATIVSRCQRYDFRRVGLESVGNLLRQILKAEGVACSDEALNAVARAADGGVRDAQSILEQLISYCGDSVAYKDVVDVLGLIDFTVLNDLCEAIIAKDIAKQLALVDEVVISGKDLSQFVQDILEYFRNLLVCKTADAKQLLALPEAEIAALQSVADKLSLTELIKLVEQFAELSKSFDSQLAQRIALEAMLIRISKVAVELSVDTVLEKIAQLGAGGIGPVSLPDPAPQDSAPPQPMPPAPRPPAAPRAEGNLAYAPDEAPLPEDEPDAEPPPVTVTENNLREGWARVAERAGAANLNLAIYLGEAIPASIQGDAISLAFPADKKRAREFIEEPDQRSALEAALGSVTSNLHTFQTRLLAAVEGADAPDPEPVPNVPFGGHVSRDAALKAMENPHVANVVDVFRGRVVEIKRSSGATDPEDTAGA